MKFVKFGKYTGEPADAVDLEELVKRLGDFFLQSGFESQFYGVSQMDPERSMEALREAILRALQEGDLLPDNAMSDELREMLNDPSEPSKSCRVLNPRKSMVLSVISNLPSAWPTKVSSIRSSLHR